MAWALGFARVRAAMATLQAQWASPAGLSVLRDRVDRQGMGRPGQPWRFGSLGQPAKAVDESCQVNILTVGRLSDPLDDFYGAMGEATLKVAVSGIVTSTGAGKTTIRIDELGFYLRDSYDFNDGDRAFLSQPLGFWGFGGVSRIDLGGRVSISERWSNEGEAKARGHVYLGSRTRTSADGVACMDEAATSSFCPMCIGCACRFPYRWSGHEAA